VQDVTGDAINRVNSYNWTGSTAPLLQALLLDISRYNDTAWDTYSRLDLTLEHMAGTFWNSLSTSVNALPTTNDFRLLQVFGVISEGWRVITSAKEVIIVYHHHRLLRQKAAKYHIRTQKYTKLHTQNMTQNYT